MTTLDLSNHDYGTFNPACLAAAGVKRVIVGCWDLAITTDIVARCRSVGIVAEELYCFLYPGLPWELREVQNAVEVQRRLGGIVRAWPDCESHFTEDPSDLDTEAPGMTPAGRIAALRRARAALAAAGMRLGTYTGEPWWRANMANTDEFAGDPLWLANYGTNDPARPRAPIREVNFGGWRTVYRHQYSSTIVVCGRNRDHNYDLMEGEMSAWDVARLDRMERALTGLEGAGAAARLEAWNRYPTGHKFEGLYNGNSLLDGYILRANELGLVTQALLEHQANHPSGPSADAGLRDELIERLQDMLEGLQALGKNAAAAKATTPGPSPD